MFRMINIDPYFFGTSLWIYYFSADSLWTYYLFLDFSMKWLDLSWINFEFTIIFLKKLWIHSVLHDKTLKTWNSLSVFVNPLSIPYLFSIWSEIHYEFPNFFANSLLIYYVLRKFTSNLLFFANSPWIFFIANWQSPCAFTFNPLSISQIHF